MAMGSPVSRLQQPSTEQPELYHLAADTINLYPVPNSHSVWAHQNKPAAECQDEILEHHRQSPAPRESHKRLLRSHSIIEDAQDVLLSAYPLQPLDSFGT